MDQKISIETVNETNFELFKNLVLQQASHHSCKYKGSDQEFLNQIIDDNSPVNVIMAMDNKKK